MQWWPLIGVVVGGLLTLLATTLRDWRADRRQDARDDRVRQLEWLCELQELAVDYCESADVLARNCHLGDWNDELQAGLPKVHSYQRRVNLLAIRVDDPTIDDALALLSRGLIHYEVGGPLEVPPIGDHDARFNDYMDSPGVDDMVEGRRLLDSRLRQLISAARGPKARFRRVELDLSSDE